MKKQVQKTQMPWDQSAFDKLQASWSPERRAEDEKLLQEIFKLAKYSPTLRQALDWAQAHGIKFFVDRTVVNCGGYYMPGTGVFAIAARNARPSAWAVEIIVHELRHAWQDYHGLCPTAFPKATDTQSFFDYFAQLSLIEADAFSFGKMAEAEYVKAQQELQIAEMKKRGLSDSLIPSLTPTEPEDVFLRKKFLSWFTTTGIAQFYGDDASKKLGANAGIYQGLLPERRFEFLPDISPVGTGVDVSNLKNVFALGRNFSGKKNYLSGLPCDLLPRKVLSPSLAASFYNAANSNQKKLVAEIRKHDLRRKVSAALQKQKP